MPWLLNGIYLVLVLAVAPVIAYRRLMQGKYREGWGQKLFGSLPRRDGKRSCVWFHAVSVGEVLQLQGVLNELEAARPDLEIVITTTTGTGQAVAREKFSRHRICYFPLDFTWAVRRAIRRIRPVAIVLVELELWPNFLFAARDAGVPLTLINGRIGEKSFRGYRRVRPQMRRVLTCFDLLAVQNETYARRLIELGAPADRVHVTGSIKFDSLETDRRNPKSENLRRAFGLADHERVFIAGSTQAPEEEYALQTWLALRAKHPDLRLILVPRHKERFDEVARLVERRGLPLIRRSRGVEGRGSRVESRTEELSVSPSLRPSIPLSPPHPFSPSSPVLLLDTLGELAACWGLADIAFVGGSLTRRGGQNMIEPAGYGAAVLFGPNTWNFRDVVELLLQGDAARVVRDGDDLTRVVAALLAHPDAARAQGRRAHRLVLAQQGATARTVRHLLALLEGMAAESGNNCVPDIHFHLRIGVDRIDSEDVG